MTTAAGASGAGPRRGKRNKSLKRRFPKACEGFFRMGLGAKGLSNLLKVHR